jgi:uncharacterized membrane protein YkvA (DUF1232 family)
MANDNLANRVLQSIFFRNATRKAGRYASNTKSLLELLQQALSKSNQIAESENKGMFVVMRERITVLGRMLKAYASGQYRVLPWKSLLKIIAAILYFVSPIDVIPDLVPVLGFTDDVALILWVYRSLRDDIDDFLFWENSTAQ